MLLRSTRSLVRRAAIFIPFRICSTSSLSHIAPRLSVSSIISATPRRCYCTGKDSENTAASEKSDASTLLDRDIVKQRVMDVVKNFEKVDASKVSENSHFVQDLGLDSLDVVEVVMALEQEFVVDIPDNDAEKIQSIEEAIDYIAANPSAK